MTLSVFLKCLIDFIKIGQKMQGCNYQQSLLFGGDEEVGQTAYIDNVYSVPTALRTFWGNTISTNLSSLWDSSQQFSSSYRDDILIENKKGLR